MPRDFPDWLNLIQPGAREVVNGNIAAGTVIIPAPGPTLAIQVYGAFFAGIVVSTPSLREQTPAHVLVRTLWQASMTNGNDASFDLGGVILGAGNELQCQPGAGVIYTVVYTLVQVA